MQIMKHRKGRKTAAWLLSCVMLVSGSMVLPAHAEETWLDSEIQQDLIAPVEMTSEPGEDLPSEFFEDVVQDQLPSASDPEVMWEDLTESEEVFEENALGEEGLYEEEGLINDMNPASVSESDADLFEEEYVLPDGWETQLEEPEIQSDLWVNPVYEDIVNPEDLIPEEEILLEDEEEVFASAQETASFLDEKLGSAGVTETAEDLYSGESAPQEEFLIDGETETAVFEAEELLASQGYYLADQADTLAECLRGYLKSRTVKFTVGMAGQADQNDILSTAKTALFAAMAHTGDPAEGDYLRYQLGGYYSVQYKFTYDGTMFYLVTYIMTYYTSAAEEAAMDAAVHTLLPAMKSAGNAYSQAKAAYSWLADHVKYDSRATTDPGYLSMYTGYAALVNREAVCQGYAVALYRLLLEMGIDCRIVDGKGITADGTKTVDHAWNIIRMGDSWYNADVTWDAGLLSSKWFLKGNTSANFARHILDTKFNTTAFRSAYPMSSANYVLSAAACPVNGTHVARYAAAVPPTCERSGLTQGTVCAYCNLTLSGRELVHPAGHAYTGWSTVTMPSITAPGLQLRACVHCNMIQHRYVDKADPFISLNINRKTIRLKRGRTKKIIASYAYGDKVVRYKSSKPKVVTVTRKGRLKAKKKGKAKITVTLKSGLKKSFWVRVR